MATKALFPGSFDPFTKGHWDIVHRALGLFDHIVIGIGHNSTKQRLFDIQKHKADIESYFRGKSNIEVLIYEGLTIDMANRLQATHLLRGLRNGTDFAYEQAIAQTNLEMSGIETVFLFSSPDVAHISSTICRELYKSGRDISFLLP